MKISKTTIIFSWCYLAIWVVAFSQAPVAYFKNFTTENGLPTNQIRCISQDQSGFLWLGSSNGLIRFDGYNFETFQSNDADKYAISNDNIVKVEILPQNQLWVGFYENGLDLFNTETGKKLLHFSENDSQLPEKRITELWYEKVKNRTWIGCIRKMWVWYDHKSSKLIKVNPIAYKGNKKPLPQNNSVYDILPDPNRRDIYWLATNDGLAQYDESQNTIRYFYFDTQSSGYTTSDRLRAMVIKNYKIYIGIRGGVGLIEFDTQNFNYKEFKPKNLGKEVFLINDIETKDDNKIWIGSIDYSLGEFDLNTQDVFFHKHNPSNSFSISKGAIYDIMVDRENNTWIATNKGLSLYSVKHQHFKIFDFAHIQNETNKGLTYIDDGSNIYMGLSNNSGLSIFDKKTQKLKVVDSNESQNSELSIQRFSKDNLGNIWFVGSGKIFKYAPGKSHFQTVHLPGRLNDIKYHSIFYHNNDQIILGTRFDGLIKYNFKTLKSDSLLTDKGGLVHNRFLHEIVPDNLGRLWIGTEKGISVIDPVSFKVLKNIGKEYDLRVVYRLALDQSGKMWASSENNGAMAFDTKSFKLVKHITKKSNLPSNTIQHLTVDEQNNVWIATPLGLCRYFQKNDEIEIFNHNNGLPEDRLEASLNKLSDGWIIQGLDFGISLFRTNSLEHNQELKPPKITEFSVFGERFPLNNKLVLDTEKNFVKISFSTFNLADSRRIKFAFKLIGVNDDWVYPRNQNFVEYAKLKPGNYQFEVKAAYLGSNHWSEISILDFKILPPFYMQWWFVLLSILAAITGFYLFYQNKIIRVKNEERKMAEVNSRIFASELRALRSQMNPHFLYNCINSIKFYVVKNQPEEASIYLNKFSKLIRKILNNSELEFISLYDEIQTLELYLEMEQLRFGDKMRFEIHIDPNLEQHFIKIPTMMIQPFIENAIWHGIMQKNESDGLLTLKFEEFGLEKVRITVEDNGVGRKKAAELKSKSVEKNKSLGMNMTLSRMDNLNEVYDLDIKIETIDLVEDQNGESQGTRVLITMKPLTAEI